MLRWMTQCHNIDNHCTNAVYSCKNVSKFTFTLITNYGKEHNMYVLAENIYVQNIEIYKNNCWKLLNIIPVF